MKLDNMSGKTCQYKNYAMSGKEHHTKQERKKNIDLIAAIFVLTDG